MPRNAGRLTFSSSHGLAPASCLALSHASISLDIGVSFPSTMVDLPRRSFPTVAADSSRSSIPSTVLESSSSFFPSVTLASIVAAASSPATPPQQLPA
ncbi:hypothetical protein PR202_ga31090 [Eleusine coracana subsp. coracana]|uniref:Uncharacterized protein n=1 Tax=Eleusine coracana subsp. coracana TaxID=191504 RepID=A0AAV5DRE7_ELECO|nr:hypothetical protein PR202_ga31090 [Eleusine coracana subsp. coracana]